MTRPPYDLMPGTTRRWAHEQQVAERAKSFNAGLLAVSRTTFKVGDRAYYGGKFLVEITVVQPAGFISAPAKYDCFGRMSGPVTCDEDLYQFKALTAQGPASGQTTAKYLRKTRDLSPAH